MTAQITALGGVLKIGTGTCVVFLMSAGHL